MSISISNKIRKFVRKTGVIALLLTLSTFYLPSNLALAQAEQSICRNFDVTETVYLDQLLCYNQEQNRWLDLGPGGRCLTEYGYEQRPIGNPDEAKQAACQIADFKAFFETFCEKGCIGNGTHVGEPSFDGSSATCIATKICVLDDDPMKRLPQASQIFTSEG